jgi:hypothetical protein
MSITVRKTFRQDESRRRANPDLDETLAGIPTIFGRLSFVGKLAQTQKGHDSNLHNEHRRLFAEWLSKAASFRAAAKLEYPMVCSTARTLSARG